METSEVGRFIQWTGRDFKSFAELHEWSVTDIEGFWGAIADFFEIDWKTKPERVLGSADFPGAKWFPGGELNYAEHLLRTDPGRPAVVSYGQGHEPRSLTMDELRAQVARARAGLKRLGVGRGDRVVAYMPNVPETLIAFAACASLGAVWASCAPELGPRSVIDRLSQLDAKVLLTVDGYNFRDKWIDRTAEVATITAALPTLEHVVHVPADWDALVAEDGPLEFDAVPFDHPLYVLFSSGTTGIPKAIVHGHGGILDRAPQGARAELGPEARRPPPLVLDDDVDDVERARLGAAARLVDRDDRRRPGLARPRLAVAHRRGDAAVVHGRVGRLRVRLPQRRAPAPRARPRDRSTSSAPRARRCRSRATAGSPSNSPASCT